MLETELANPTNVKYSNLLLYGFKSFKSFIPYCLDTIFLFSTISSSFINLGRYITYREYFLLY
jgi:hypothetical protein